MITPSRYILLLVAVLACHIAMKPVAAETDQSAKTITWDDLLPPGEFELLEKMMEESGQGLAPGHSADLELDLVPEQIGTFNTVAELNGKLIRLPGYVLPLEFEIRGEITEFLLVPYLGACIHMPPPPPNQIVYVQSKKPDDYGQLWQPVWITGVIKTETSINGLGNTAYTMDLIEWKFYDE